MFSRVIMENCKGLTKVDAPLRPLTVLVGANDTGKSTFLEAVRRLHVGGEMVPNFGKPRDAVICKLFSEYTHQWAGLDPAARHPRTPTGASAVPTRHITRLPASGVPLEGDGQADAAGVPELGAGGEGVAALLDYFLRHDRERLDAYTTALREQVPGLLDVQIATPSAQSRRVDLILSGKHRMPANEASTGVRALIYFLALAYHPTPPSLILLEEPEAGLHPKRLEEVMGLLRSITNGVHGGHKAQVILSTHSPYLLDCVDLATDQVLVFRRHQDGTRTAEAADAERLKIFLDEFKLGEVWFNRGEDGLVTKGKNP